MSTLSLRGALKAQGIGEQSVSVQHLQSTFLPEPKESLRALLLQMVPQIENVFDPEIHAFHFKNSWSFTGQDGEEIGKRLGAAADRALQSVLNTVRTKILDIRVTLVPSIPTPCGYTKPVIAGVPTQVIDQVIKVITSNRSEIFKHIFSFMPSKSYGRCGGMAFAGLDFFIAGWPVDARFGKEPPINGPLREYIWTRLLDSLELNLEDFLLLTIDLHYVDRLATAALGAAIGNMVGGPLVALLLAYIGSRVTIFNLGGSGRLFSRSKAEWNLLTKILDNDPEAWPIGLIYGNKKNPIHQHQVLAIGYRDDGPDRRTLRVWDNNFGNEASDWVMDFTGSELHVENANNDIKCFFCERYEFKRPPTTLKLPSL